jgi:hypothetical protein
VSTLSLTSALSITRAANPPRAAYLDFPLGHTAGKPHRGDLNHDIVRDALRAFETLTQPGQVVMLRYGWADDDAWKDGVMRPRSPGSTHDDARVERAAQPQYQSEADRAAAEAALASGGCPTCVWLDNDAERS